MIWAVSGEQWSSAQEDKGGCVHSIEADWHIKTNATPLDREKHGNIRGKKRSAYFRRICRAARAMIPMMISQRFMLMAFEVSWLAFSIASVNEAVEAFRSAFIL